MPGVDRLGWRHGLLDAVAEARSVGVNSVVLFPKVETPYRHLLNTLSSFGASAFHGGGCALLMGHRF